MQRSRSFWRLMWPSGAALLLAANCTVKVEESDAKGGATSANGGATSSSGGADTTKGGSSESNGGTAVSSGGSATTSGGSTSYGGTWVASGGAGGVGPIEGGAGGAGGAGGEGGAGIDVCDDCLLMNCPSELDACLNDVRCFNDDPSAPGQYQDMVQCMDEKRQMANVTRADVVDCGIIVANSASLAWPPDEMATTTTDLINCMATGEANKPNNSSWADGDATVPTDPVAQKWAPTSCAKTSCTAQLSQ
ncbi:MAG: hypothetical protein QM756_39955 [Polyangiaceae bacterium]